MKKTSVKPSATFDQMPSPNHNMKIGASTTRGNAFAIFTYGSNTAATRGWRANQKPMTMPEIKWYTKQIFNGLAHMHEQGIAHRDLKPENILLKVPGNDKNLVNPLKFYQVD